jgi:hypothetical protein
VIKIQIIIGHPIKFSKNSFDLFVGSISVIFGGVGAFHVVVDVDVYVDFFYI